MLLDRERKRIPELCPFCGCDEFVIRFWVAHYFCGELKKDRDDGIQVFCSDCEEEIRAEDVGRGD